MFNLLSTNERNYLITRLNSNEVLREDNRSQFKYRPIAIKQLEDNGQVEVKIGLTRIISQIYAKIVTPYVDRPNEGQAVFSIDTNHLKSNAEFMQSNEDLNEFRTHLNNLLEKGLRETKALDTNSLCIIPGKLVWKIVIDINIINNDGNVYDACLLSAVASWLSYRIPFLRKKGSKIISDFNKIFLTMLHIPICITFGLFNNGTKLQYICDATLKEEMVMNGMMNVTANIFDSICYLQFTSEIQVSCDEINKMLMLAKEKIKELHKILKEFIENTKRKAKKNDNNVKVNVNTNVDVEMKDGSNKKEKIISPFDDCKFMSKVNSHLPQRKHFDLLSYNIN